MIDKIIEEIDKLEVCDFSLIESSELKTMIKKQEVMKAINQAVKENNNGWVKCSDRLPDKQIRVLVKTDKSPLVIGWLMFDEWYTDFGNGYGNLDVIAWQPLPEPFKERD